jgi:hypothetical protein
MSLSKSQAAWMTASSCGNRVIQASGEAMSPGSGVAPRSASFVPDASERARPCISCPRPISSRTTAEPIEPVPPSTRMRKPFSNVDECPRAKRRHDSILRSLHSHIAPQCVDTKSSQSKPDQEKFFSI